MNQRERRRLAKFRAALILQSMMNGWHPEDLIEKYGQQEVDLVADEINSIAQKLINKS
jgi:hypothetical protein